MLELAGEAFFVPIAFFFAGAFFAASAFLAAATGFRDTEALVFDFTGVFFLGLDSEVFELSAFFDSDFVKARSAFFAADLCFAHRLRWAAAIRSLASGLKFLLVGDLCSVPVELTLFFDPAGRPRFFAGNVLEVELADMVLKELPCSLRRSRT